ncbi:RNA ligase family protein [Promicromonospora kroppenstedtii]|uniref:RNA ligase family protein n=1 Tax=Promicromonospora kroppenstedtii TaxID=440482 RepID=UPI0004B2604B|nr:RNA ligase family protein [Promicromonospora kroppenstedtii]
MSAPITFEGWPKTPRLFRDCIITEKIDGTNAAVIVTEDGQVAAQSRTRLSTPGKSTDNFGFAAWVAEHEDSLLPLLGPGRHFGEWWGKGIQRGYGLDERRFSLFNVGRYGALAEESDGLLHTVPVLYQGPFATDIVADVLDELVEKGSAAERGFATPEGVVVYHAAARQVFKVLIENDDQPKGA